MRGAVLAVAVLPIAACIPPSVKVTAAGPQLALAPRPADCDLEFYRTRPPERPYDEIAAVNVKAYQDDPAAAQEALRSRACVLGADAVVVTQEFVLGYMTGTAVSYRDMREGHRVDADRRKREAERFAAEQEAAREAVAKTHATNAGSFRGGPPAGFLQATVKLPVRARALPDRRGQELDDLAVGTEVWVAAKPSAGWRRIWVPGEASAWVDDDAVELKRPGAAQRTPVAPVEPRP